MIHRRLFRYVPPRPPNFNVVLVLIFFGSVLALAINIEIWGAGGIANRRRCCLIDTANRPGTPTLSKNYNASKHFSRFRIALSASGLPSGMFLKSSAFGQQIIYTHIYMHTCRFILIYERICIYMANVCYGIYICVSMCIYV